MELDADDRVVGIAGLSLRWTPHEFVLDNVPLHIWCGVDALGIPSALGQNAIARSQSGRCGTSIEVVCDDGRRTNRPVVAWYPTGAPSEVRRDFWAIANLYYCLDHLAGSPKLYRRPVKLRLSKKPCSAAARSWPQRPSHSHGSRNGCVR